MNSSFFIIKYIKMDYLQLFQMIQYKQKKYSNLLFIFTEYNLYSYIYSKYFCVNINLYRIINNVVNYLIDGNHYINEKGEIEEEFYINYFSLKYMK